MAVIIFNVFQATASGYALWKGGAPERLAAALLLLAALATWLVPAAEHSFSNVFWPIFGIDVTLLLALVLIAAFADRFWPMWMAALQLVAIAAHGVRAYEPGLWAMAYWLIIGTIAYPMLALLVAGAWRHQRRLGRGSEFDWTVQRWRHDRVDQGRVAGE